jgi:glycosyltransferase involved in cell wall biosynthesis
MIEKVLHPVSEYKMNDARMKSFLLLPHWRTGGGAGYYICDLIDALRQIGIVRVAGPYGGYYDHDPIISRHLNYVTLLSMPTYEGIRTISILYNIVLSAIRALVSLTIPRFKKYENKYDAIVLTSSVQAIAVPIIRSLFPNSRTVIIVQENVCLSNGFGWLTRWFLPQADLVVSITETWAQHAQENALYPIVLPNRYNASYARPESNLEPEIGSDLLYVGGGARIKGFDNFLSVLPALLEAPDRQIICLGQYHEEARKSIEKICSSARQGARLEMVGHVADIRPYLRGTKLLLLPIGSPHFCRPAIEAGFFGKTFLIPDFPELADFVMDGKNCATYEATKLDGLTERVEELLNNDGIRSRLGAGNREFAIQFNSRQAEMLKNFLSTLSRNV